MSKARRRARFPIHLQREAVTLALLVSLSITLFLGVTALSRLFHAQQNRLADRWSSRGAADLAAGRFNGAFSDYRSSLRHAPDRNATQLGLAEALIGLKQTSEATVYLKNLWEAEPENGVVNRDLARIAAGRGDMPSALRYYHNAIYAIWTGDGERERRETRWELIGYLLNNKAMAQAQSELIALDAEVGDDPGQQLRLGETLLKVQDHQHALAAFRIVLASDPHNPAALAGAGAAAFGMGDYSRAQSYLHAATNENPADGVSSSLLEVADQVMRLDPFRRQISETERERAVADVYATTGERLTSCPAAARSPDGSSGQQTLGDAWNSLKPQVNAHDLRRNQDIMNRVLSLALSAERQAGTRCGPGTPADTALLLISTQHERN